ncbi:MAG: glycosyltransferase family 87 protein [Terriglobia bacterium]
MEARRFWTDRVFRAVLTTAVFSLVTGFAVFSFPSTKADQTNAIDFSTFYCAGLMVRQGFGHRLYSVEDQKHCLSQVGSAGVFYLRPPFESLLFIPLSYFSYPRAYLLWTLTSVLMLVVSAYLIDLLTAASGVITQYTNFRADIAFLLCIFVTFSPFTTSLMLGQDATLVLLIYTLTFVLLVRRRDLGAGLLLGCALFKFQLVLPLAFVLLLRRKWHVLLGLGASGAILLLSSVAICGRVVLVQYTRFLRDPDPNINLLRLYPSYMPNARGMLSLMLGSFCSARSIAILTIAVSFLLVCLAAGYWNDDNPKLSFAVALLASLLSTYHLHNYDLTLLLLAIPIICGERLSRVARWAIAAILIPPLHLLLMTHGIYALMFVPVTALLLSAISVLRYQGDLRSAGFGAP